MAWIGIGFDKSSFIPKHFVKNLQHFFLVFTTLL